MKVSQKTRFEKTVPYRKKVEGLNKKKGKKEGSMYLIEKRLSSAI